MEETTMRTLALSTLLFVFAALAAAGGAAGQVIDLAGKDMRPLLQVQAIGADIAGQPFETDVFVYHGGATFLMHSRGLDGSERVARGVASSAALVRLNQELALAHIGQLRGGCGEPAPDHVESYRLTWFGKQRLRTLPLGGNFSDCPDAVHRVMEAVCAFLWEAVGPAPEYCVPEDN
jgi:hypothetical protein